MSLPVDGHTNEVIQPGEYKPEVSPKVRDVAYFIGLGLSFVAQGYVHVHRPVRNAVSGLSVLSR